ncbi:Pentatricopeptide repeat-containing protein, mitochondrial [Sesamum alatum]|uniref:Pentatricopeptide repeat-containing protein, mitochondrial n=1 Tax=Sesamum alatum TaxID=300844 RepID=A0AAE1Z266_9LAMI|nr:Pentatricopeptide repeat-containing protein, mitochondrial [Sesamum alatum]
MIHGKLSNIRALVQLSTVSPSKEVNSPTASSLASALQHYINSDHPSHGQKIHSHILKTGFNANVNISIKLLILYLKSSCLSYARQVFDELPRPTLSAYNYMISGYIKHGFVEKSFDLVRELCWSNEKPDGYTYSMILKGSTSGNGGLCSPCIGGEVHAQIVKSDVEGDDVLYTALVDSYVKSGRVEYARRVFDLMLEQNVICSTSMITGYMNQGRFEDAEDVFEKTVEKDVVVYNAMIEGYRRAIFESMDRDYSMKPRMEHYACMVDLLGRAGSLNQALEFVTQMPEKPNSDVWAALLSSCRLHGDVELAKIAADELFKVSNESRPGAYVALSNTLAEAGRWDSVSQLRDLMKVRGISKGTGFTWVGTDAGLEAFHAGQLS